MKGRIYKFGTMVVNKVEQDERFLKSMPEIADVNDASLKIPLHYPSALPLPEVEAHFKEFIRGRETYHKKYMYYSVVWIPFSSLFSILPLLPNIPLFYNLYRLYGHYKAWRGAQHLASATSQNRIAFSAATELNIALELPKKTEPAPKSTSQTQQTSNSDTGKNAEQDLLFFKSQVIDDACIDELAKKFKEEVPNLKEEVTLTRQQAIEQLKKDSERTSNAQKSKEI